MKKLTRRQREVLDLLSEGKSNKIIAYELDIRESTVKVHIRNLMRRYKTTNRTALAVTALKEQLCLATT